MTDLSTDTAHLQGILFILSGPSGVGKDTVLRHALPHRLENARQEMARADQYEYLVVNDRVEDASARLQAIVTAERCRPFRQDLHGLVEF